MKKIAYTFFCISLLLVCLSCALDEDIVRKIGDESFEKREGYQPLASQMYWMYENREADYNTDFQKWEYRDTSPINSEIFIAKANNLLETDDTGTRNVIRYEFAPIADVGFFGGLLGNLQQVYKDPSTGIYRRSEIITLKTKDNPVPGEEDDKLSIKIQDFPYLKDDLTVGEVLYVKRDSVISEDDIAGGGKSTMIYEYTIKVVGISNKIPIKYASAIGIDDHLLDFSDIVHIREALEVITINSTGATVTTIVDAKIEITPDNGNSFFKANIDTQHTLEGISGLDLFLTPLRLTPIPFISNPDGYTRSYDRNTIRTQAPEVFAKVCPAGADFSGTTVTEGSTLEMIANQTPFIRDIFYARNIGKIKTITSLRGIVGQMKTEEFNVIGDPTEIIPLTNYNCLDNINEMALSLVSQSITNQSTINIPLIFGEDIAIITNIKKYNVK